jgi:hypothetical protein
VRITGTRPNVVVVTATRAELATLAAGARMALDLMHRDPAAPAGPRAALARALDDYEAAIGRMTEGEISCTCTSSSSASMA